MTKKEMEIAIKGFVDVIKENDMSHNDFVEITKKVKTMLTNHIHKHPIPFRRKTEEVFEQEADKENTTTKNSDVNARIRIDDSLTIEASEIILSGLKGQL